MEINANHFWLQWLMNPVSGNGLKYLYQKYYKICCNVVRIRLVCFMLYIYKKSQNCSDWLKISAYFNSGNSYCQITRIVTSLSRPHSIQPGRK